ncbi:MAG: hypothetical protein QMD01_02040 [Thermodesulfovibrionales bacterium]|nr:hypothetical protein [Thermodesulfovibrionales bacterium]
MKKMYLLLIILSLSLTAKAHAAFVSGSTGADGAFNPTANTEVTLPADGVLNYTTVNIPSGVTVTFKKNAANTPVYILATGDVSIAGIVSVDGGAASGTVPGSGGPGGYNGGNGAASQIPAGNGLGPGGGKGGTTGCLYGGGGGYGANGSNYNGCGNGGGLAYGNALISPLIGGSGGGGSAASSAYGGGGGGGALLIASSGSIILTGTLRANGGECYNPSGGGSGGAIKLIANTISGNGTISAKGAYTTTASPGGAGRIRLEAYSNNFVPWHKSTLYLWITRKCFPCQ